MTYSVGSLMQAYAEYLDWIAGSEAPNAVDGYFGVDGDDEELHWICERNEERWIKEEQEWETEKQLQRYLQHERLEIADSMEDAVRYANSEEYGWFYDYDRPDLAD